MKNTGLMIAAVMLATLTGVLYWSNRHPTSESTAKASLDTPPKILSLKLEDISNIQIKKKGGEELALAKSDTGKWQITAPKPLGADQDAVSSLLSTVSSLNADRLVEDKASDVSQYGLAQPSLELDVTTKDGKPQKLFLGDDTPAGSAVFAKLEGDPRVFTLATYNKTSIDKTANDLRDKRLLTIDFEKLSQIELVTKKQDIEFGRNKQEWQIVKPKPLRADNFQVEEIVRKLRDAKMEASSTDADAKKAAAAFASGAQVATAKVTDAASTQELQIRKSKDDYYAKSTAVPGIYKVPNDIGQGLDKNVDDFRSKKLFDFGFDEPGKVELRDGAKTYYLTKGGQDWWSDGKKMDASSVQSLIDKIRELSASKFLDSGFTTPAIEVTVTSNDGKRVEKVLISKAGDTYIAKRENEPALYQLDSSFVADLQKIAADLKPVAVSGKK
ncbi:MAG TPA: DUF4340 domain-containing protein [Candidatus Acidoferrum sp.]|nr:DUF4340 domain-containing protein [Candidatus Acidoferrum sp.]